MGFWARLADLDCAIPSESEISRVLVTSIERLCKVPSRIRESNATSFANAAVQSARREFVVA